MRAENKSTGITLNGKNQKAHSTETMNAIEAKSKTEAPKLKMQHGLVGFFDILGYQSFLENNSAEAATEKVLTTLTNVDKLIPQKVLEGLSARSYADAHAGYKKVMEHGAWLIFSDTILTTLEFKESLSAEQIGFYQSAFVMQSNVLWRELFSFGLPIRGAITRGNFVVMDNKCFAGEAIIEAYRLASSLDLSAVAISKKAHEWMKEKWTKRTLDCFVSNYLTPTKQG